MGHLPLGLIPAAGSLLPFPGWHCLGWGKKKTDQENCHLPLGSLPVAYQGLDVCERGLGSAVGGHQRGWAWEGLCWIWILVFCAQLLLSILPPLPPAMQQVLDNLGSLPNATGAAELDLIFLRGIMESPIVRSLAKVWCVSGRW